MFCAFDEEEAGKCGESGLSSGLYAGHCYSILKVVEAEGNQLICFRNPWGCGEWTGKWSDKNAEGEWTDTMKAACRFWADSKDGKFWMSVEDYVANATNCFYGRSFGPGWKKLTQYFHFHDEAEAAAANAEAEAA